jgi:tRNA threonylcarbamoyladenosine biosynthesis protein TsaE
VVVFSGPLGAGKSTLIRVLGRRLGIARLPSPTYVLVRHAKPKRGPFKRLVHADLYRLPKGSSLVPLGLTEDLTDPDALVLIEWPERAKKLTPDVRVQLSGSGNRRTIRISSH